MVESVVPDTWVDLQVNVAKILSECGLESETPKTRKTARATVEVDVCAIDNSLSPAPIYLCECKHWKTKPCFTLRTDADPGPGAHDGGKSCTAVETGFKSNSRRRSTSLTSNKGGWPDGRTLYLELRLPFMKQDGGHTWGRQKMSQST